MIKGLEPILAIYFIGPLPPKKIKNDIFLTPPLAP